MRSDGFTTMGRRCGSPRLLHVVASSHRSPLGSILPRITRRWTVRGHNLAQSPSTREALGGYAAGLPSRIAPLPIIAEDHPVARQERRYLEAGSAPNATREGR